MSRDEWQSTTGGRPTMFEVWLLQFRDEWQSTTGGRPTMFEVWLLQFRDEWSNGISDEPWGVWAKKRLLMLIAS
jgi:hypothetical protein